MHLLGGELDSGKQVRLPSPSQALVASHLLRFLSFRCASEDEFESLVQFIFDGFGVGHVVRKLFNEATFLLFRI